MTWASGPSGHSSASHTSAHSPALRDSCPHWVPRVAEEESASVGSWGRGGVAEGVGILNQAASLFLCDDS